MLLFISISFLVPIVAALFGLGFGLKLYQHNQKAAKARSISMEQLAQKLGLTFSGDDTFGLATQLQGFDLFERERSRWMRKGKITNVMRGLLGDTDVYLFDYSYKVSTGKSTKIVAQTVFFANDKNWFLPNFQLEPERWWHKLKTKLGLDSDINFAENPKFSEKFWLKSEFEGIVREQFTPELQGFLTEKPPAQLEGSNYYLIGYKPGKKLAPQDAQIFFQHCCEIVRLLQAKGKLELLDLAELKQEPVLVKNERLG